MLNFMKGIDMKRFLRLYDSFLKNHIQIKVFFGISFIFFAVIIAAVSFFVSYEYEENYLKNSIKSDAYDFIDSKVSYLDRRLNMHRNNLIAVSQNRIFRDYALKGKDKGKAVSLFEQIIRSHKDIMQIRFLDSAGMENIRIERGRSTENYKVTEPEALQYKGERYYFKETAKIKSENTVWISDIDLNIENNQIQRPFVPTVRLAVPVYNEQNFKGIVIINLFMKKVLAHMTESDMFVVSIIDGDGEFLIGKNEVRGEVLDYSWSRYLLKKIDIKNFAPEYMDKILNTYRFSTNTIYSKKISKDLDLIQDLTLVLKIKQERIDEIKDNTLNKIFNTLAIILLLSGPIGVLFALIPSKLANRVYDTSKKLEEKTMVFDEYLEAMNINNIISKSDLRGRITYVNENFCSVTGYTKEEVLGKPHSLLRDPNTPKETFKILWLTIQAKKIWKGILRNRKKDGTYYDVDIAIMPILNTRDEIIEYLAIRHDITELIRQRKDLISIATTDQLTGTGNRYKLVNDIKGHILNNVAVIDIDNFSLINDLYGHKVGDEVIIKFAGLLKDNITNEFTLYRLHGDKFAILNFSLDSERFTNFITHLNTKMIESVISTKVKDFDIVTTSGVSAQDNEILLSTAEIANKYAKKMNKKVLMYSKELNIEAKFEENIKWTEKIKKALTEDMFEVYYQPIFNNYTQRIEKYESLVRLIDEDGTVISPYYFLEIAKSTGQYIDITKKVIDKSFEKFKDLDLEFSINLTVEDILDNELCSYLEEMIELYALAERLVIELVESEGIEQFDQVHKFIKRLKSFGCKVAIDDFGTGYSNFEYLIKLEADYIKIDGSMIKNINSDENMKQIVETIVEFARKMGYKTIAEFVSSKEILSAVKDMGVNYSQGYFIGAPDPEIKD